MSEEERDLASNKALVSISMLTGWTMPADDRTGEKMEFLISQFSKKMAENYQNLNMEELEYAFRNKDLDVKDWGKPINLAMLDDVLQVYLHKRSDLSLQEEKISSQLPKEELEKLPEPMSDAEWDEWLLDISKYEVNKIPCDSYAYLVRKGEISLSGDEKNQYMERAVKYLSSTTEITSHYGIELERMKKKGEYSVEVSGTLRTIAKRLVVFDYFSKKQKP